MKKIIPLGEKKDINVNTLFPARLVKKLDEWAWRNRLTRSAALRILVENAFAQHKEQKEVSPLPELMDAQQNSPSNDNLQTMIKQALDICTEQAQRQEQLYCKLEEYGSELKLFQDKIARIEEKIF